MVLVILAQAIVRVLILIQIAKQVVFTTDELTAGLTYFSLSEQTASRVLSPVKIKGWGGFPTTAAPRVYWVYILAPPLASSNEVRVRRLVHASYFCAPGKYG